MSINFSTFPRTQAPPPFVQSVINVFKSHEPTIGTTHQKGLKSNEVLAVLRPDLLDLGFEVEAGNKKIDKILRPVLFGPDAEPELEYEIDAWHPDWNAGLEIEAARAVKGNAIYRDLVQALVMVDMKHLFLAVAHSYRYRPSGKPAKSRDFDKTVKVANALYAHSRVVIPYSLCVIGY